MKKSIFSISLTLIMCYTLFGQVPQWDWAKRAGGSLDDYIWNSTIDQGGWLYATGEFASSSITFGNTTLYRSGSVDYFLAKYDSHGNVVWAKGAGGSSLKYGYSVTTDASSNVYVTGSFENSSITFGSITLTNSGSSEDAFIVKYDSSGNVIWARQIGGNGNEGGRSIFADLYGNVYLFGDFVGNFSIGNTSLINHGQCDIFIAKFDSSGNVIWARSAGGTGNDYSKGITNDIDGNVYLTGEFYNASINFGTVVLNNSGDADMFIAKYDSVGNFKWARKGAGTGGDCGNSIISDADGNSYVVGEFMGPSMTIGNYILNNLSVAINYDYDIFIAKYDSSGNVIWAQRAGGNTTEFCRSITSDHIGNLYITGWFESTNITFGNSTFTNLGTLGDIYMAKFDTAGNALWAANAGSSSVDRAYSICIDYPGNLYISGFFRSPSIIVGHDTLLNAGHDDILIAKIPSKYIVGINKIENDDIFQLSPNPSNGNVFVRFPSDTKNIQISNSLGQIVQNHVVNNQKCINLYLPDDGIYFINIRSHKQLITKKLIVCK